MNKKFTKKKYRFKNNNPPFHWPLILLIVIFVEIGTLIQERAWSQNYIVVIDSLRDQADNLSYENQKLFNRLANFYDFVFINEEEIYLTKAKRILLNLNKKISLLDETE